MEFGGGLEKIKGAAYAQHVRIVIKDFEADPEKPMETARKLSEHVNSRPDRSRP